MRGNVGLAGRHRGPTDRVSGGDGRLGLLPTAAATRTEIPYHARADVYAALDGYPRTIADVLPRRAGSDPNPLPDPDAPRGGPTERDLQHAGANPDVAPKPIGETP